MKLVNTVKNQMGSRIAGTVFLIILIVTVILFALSVGGTLLLGKSIMNLVMGFIGSIVFWWFVVPLVLGKKTTKRGK